MSFVSGPPVGPVAVFVSRACGAKYWYAFGLRVIPVVPGEKKSMGKWDPWLEVLSEKEISTHWGEFPDSDVGWIVDENCVVMDADSPESLAALVRFEKEFGCNPSMEVKTSKGEHHYFRVEAGTHVRSNTHGTEKHPDRIDVKASRSLVVLPPSPGKRVVKKVVLHARDLAPASQAFINRIAAHNGLSAPSPANPATPQVPRAEPSQSLATLAALLKEIDPNCSHDEWRNVLMAIHNETQGSEEGFRLVNQWSSPGTTYKGVAAVRAKWQSFDLNREHRYSIVTLRNMVAKGGRDWVDVSDAAEPQFQAVQPVDEPVSALERYSLHDMLPEIESKAATAKYVLGRMALKGESTVFFGPPNTGKTILTLRLFADAVRSGAVNPATVFFLNMDDTASGLAQKVRIANDFGIRMLSDGYKGFEAGMLPGLLEEFTKTGQTDVVIALDTLTKFVDTMDKTAVRRFMGHIGRFTKMGGTVIILAHCNKHTDRNGKLIPGGVSDIKNDVACAYTMQVVNSEDGGPERIVAFENIKRRGNVDWNAAYAYSNEKDISYDERFLSVHPVEETQLVAVRHAESRRTDQESIRAISACIAAGVCKRMPLGIEAAKRLHISAREAYRIIEKHTGPDSAIHPWNYAVREHNSHVFFLNTPSNGP